MELGTFGAVMGFAAQLIQQSAGLYDAASHTARNSELQSVIQALAEHARKDLQTMEQVRRENITEMILEPITDLRKEQYEIDLTAPGADTEIVTMALQLEERDREFFRCASGKVPLPEVARVFHRVVQRKEKNLSKLYSLKPDSN